MQIVKRTFEALDYPEGSDQRHWLNRDNLSSEYLPTFEYILRGDGGEETLFIYRTRQHAAQGLSMVQRRKPEGI